MEPEVLFSKSFGRASLNGDLLATSSLSVAPVSTNPASASVTPSVGGDSCPRLANVVVRV